MTAYDDVVTAIEPILKDHKLAIKIANEAINALELGGWHNTEDEYLAMMRTMRKTIFDRVSNAEIADRDLAALTNRLQAISKEVASLEEKERQENRGKSNGSSTAGQSTGTSFDPSKV